MTTPDRSDGPEINPGVHFLYDLLKWVRQGRVRVPEFQRSFVWKRSDMLDLFDSVRRRYPIGTLLFWRSPEQVVRPSTRFGPLDLSSTRPTDHLLMLIDGQQRLTTLAGALLHDAGLPLLPSGDGDEGRWSIYFDPTGLPDGSFVHLPSGGLPRPWQVPAPDLADSEKLLSFLERLYQEKVEALAEASVDRSTIVRRIQVAARALQSYKVPVVEFVTSDLTLAVEAFTRLNRKGVVIGADEMFSALTYEVGGKGDHFHVAREISQTLLEIQRAGFGELDRVLVLRAFLLHADLDPYRTNWSRLGDETRQLAAQKLPEAMERARSGLLRGIEFLREEQIHNSRMLPYGLQLVGLACWLGEDPEPSPAARRLLRRWLWLTGFSSWFGQGNPSRYTAVLNELRESARKVRAGSPVPTALVSLPWSTPAEPFPARYDLRSARVRALLCLLGRGGVLGTGGERWSAERLAAGFAERGPQAMRTLWVRCPDPLRSSPANRVFDIFGERNGQARGLFAEIHSPLREQVLSSHYLGGVPERGEEFHLRLEERLAALMQLERDFMAELELRPSDQHNPAPSPIDEDGDAPLDPEDIEGGG